MVILAALNDGDRAKFMRLDGFLRQYPADERDIMPTRLGNVLRAAELRPLERYGLDGVICWSRLWLTLTESVRGAIDQSRESLDTDVRGCVYTSVLLAFFAGARRLARHCIVDPAMVDLLSSRDRVG